MAISTIHRTKLKGRQNRPLEEYYAEQKKRERRLGKLTLHDSRKLFSSFWFFMGIVLLLISGIFLATYFIQNRKVQAINISIDSMNEGYFINEEDINNILVSENRSILDERMKEISLSELESDLKANPFVKDAEVYKSLNGILDVWLTTRIPVARIINNNGEKIYIDDEGLKFPSSERFSAHVPLIRGNFQEILFPQDSFDCRIIEATLPLLAFIHRDPFWSEQISEIFIKEDGELVLYPQVGNTYVEFGQPNLIEEKFADLDLFYRKVLNKVGWDSYKGVSVKFRQQLIGIK